MQFSGLAGSLLLLVGTLSAHAQAGDAWLKFGKNADRLEARMGIMSYDTGFFTQHNQTGVVVNGELVFPSPSFLDFIGSPRPYIGFDFAPNSNQTDFVYAGLNWEAYFTERVYLTASIGGSLNNASDLINPVGYRALGCRALFHLGAGIGFDITSDVTVQLYADHFSNANICRKNGGQEAAGVRFGYRF